MPDLLLELFSEEIPARMQAKAADDLRRLITEGLVERGLTYAHAAAFATPRRLTLALEGLSDHSPSLREERKGPRTDAPEAALAGFLRSTGLTKDQLEVRDDKKAQVWFAVSRKPGRPAADIVAETVEAVVRAFPWPKSMRWGDGSLRWVRPLHSILCLLTTETGADVVPFAIDGIASGDLTRGHRFIAPAAFKVTGFEDYAAKLQRAFVLLDPTERADRIWHDATQLAFAQGLEVVEDQPLLTEISGLVEWPVVLLGRIAEAFLDLPPEVLQTSMRAHQKFLSVRDPASGRIEAYIVVANRETADNGATILAGNAKVLAARLADAKFFWENDVRTPLEEMAAKLEAVTFHNKLGTQGQRIARIAALAREIAPTVGADADLAERAAKLAKADLASQMVYEFPELQGTIGRYYAERAGEDPAVAAAAEEHYSPLGPTDALPTARVSTTVAMADKVDFLSGFWLVKETPTGSRDPFGLRRTAIGLIRILIDNRIRLNTREIILLALAGLLTQVNARKERAQTPDDLESELEGPYYSDGMFLGGITLWRNFAARNEEQTMALDEIETLKGHESDYSSVRNLELLFTTQYEADTFYDVLSRAEEALLLFHRVHRRLESLSSLLSALPQAAPGIYEYMLALSDQITVFLIDRLKVHLRGEGVRHDVIDACFQLGGQDDLVLLVARVRALQDFLATEDGANLLTGYRRASNILNQEEKKDGVEYSLAPEPRLADTRAEKLLFEALDEAEAALAPALAAEDFAAAMTALARLRAPIDQFFDTTIVNAPNSMVRRNRLCLLHRIRAVMNRVAIFSAIEG